MDTARWIKTKKTYGMDTEKSDAYTLVIGNNVDLITIFPCENVDYDENNQEINGFTVYSHSPYLAFDTFNGNTVPEFYTSIEEAKKSIYKAMLDYFKKTIEEDEEEIKMYKRIVELF